MVRKRAHAVLLLVCALIVASFMSLHVQLGGFMATTVEPALPPSAAPAVTNGPRLVLVSPKPKTPLLNGVILFLQGGRWDKYFIRECLPRLDRYMLTCFPYPVHVFHERLSESSRGAIAHALPHAGRVEFEDVSWVWQRLPQGISEATLQRWMGENVQPHFAGRGYRIMCRFWFGVVWTLRSLDRYDYYWRLDTDSVLTRPLRVDPFHHVFRDRRCEYAYIKLKGENMLVATRGGSGGSIYDEFQRWAGQALAVDNITDAAVQRVEKFAIDPLTGKYWAPMFYNNFEMGSIAMKRHKTYQSFFRFIDSNDPYGMMRYRWGDAPLHTLAVVATLDERYICHVSNETIGYQHANKRPSPLLIETLPCETQQS